jgi:anthranilate synthase component 1
MIRTHTFVADTLTPVRAYAALRRAAGASASFLLESAVGGERWGRYSILGYKPRFEATLLAAPSGTGGSAPEWVVTPEGLSDVPPLDGEAARGKDPLAAAAALFAPDDVRTPHPAERFARALVGFCGWDLVHAIDKVPGWPRTEPVTLARFFGGSTIVVFDNLAQTVTVAAEEQADIEGALAALNAPIELRAIPLPVRGGTLPEDVQTDMDDATYAARVRRAQEYIAAGDAFQIVLARTFSVPQAGRDPFDVYRAMRVINPSPYMYFLDLPPARGEATRTQVAGASPETLVRLEEGLMMVRPIAGTRARGRSLEEDEAHERELLCDPKERAEHVMLIDLGRNDVGRVAGIGSVKLARNMEIERYSHVMHIVSEVHGRVSPDVPPLEVLRAAFPAGTLSGAPKVRAMQIIRELETRPRGLYGGAVGYVAKTGDLDFAIAIRTAVCRGGVFEVTAGAGIVEASVPESEAKETRDKAKAVLCAIEAAGRAH